MTALLLVQVICVLFIIYAVTRILTAIFACELPVSSRVSAVTIYGAIAAIGSYAVYSGVYAWMLYFAVFSLTASLIVPVFVTIMTLILLLVYQAIKFDRKYGNGSFATT